MSNTIPTLTTERLTLRPFHPSDAPDVQRMAGAREIASVTKNIPHPYEDGMAESWIATHQERYETHQGLSLAITLVDTGELIGAIALMSISEAHRRAEIGYWMGVDHWGRGYCTEAGRRVLQFAFGEMDLHRVVSHHLTRNPASGRVMQKIGMTHEGTMRQHVCKWDVFEDYECYGILSEEFGQETSG